MNISRKSLMTGALILLAVHGLIYYPALTEGYFHADDWYNYEFYQEYSFADYATGDWGQGRRGEGGYYRPLSRLYFNANYALWGLWAPGHHLSNFLLHYVNVLLFWAVARRLMRSGRGAFAAALLFLLFPAHPSAVHWISGATDLIHAFWYLAAINLALAVRWGNGQSKWAMASGVLICFFGALLSKETAVGLPLVILAIEWVAFNGGRASCLPQASQPDSSNGTGRMPVLHSPPPQIQDNYITTIFRRFSLTLTALALLTIYLVFRRMVIGGVGYHLEAVMGRGILGPSVLSFLSSLMTLYSPHWSAANLAAYMIVLVALLWPLRRSRGGIVAAVWLAMAIAPMAGIVVSVTSAGWLLYLPAAAWCVILAGTISHVSQQLFRPEYWRNFIYSTALFFIVTVYVIGSYWLESKWEMASISARFAVENSQKILTDSHQRESSVNEAPRTVIVPAVSAVGDYLSPIFDPSHALHKALETTISDYYFLPSIEDRASSDALILIYNRYSMRQTKALHTHFIHHQISLYRISDIVSHSWQGRELMEEWKWGAEVKRLDDLFDDDGLIHTSIMGENESWLESPDIPLNGSMLIMMALDFETPILTEGMLEWRANLPDIEKIQTRRQLIYNDPASRVQPRRALIIQLGPKPNFYRIYPILTKGAVNWRRIELDLYKLDLAGRETQLEHHGNFKLNND